MTLNAGSLSEGPIGAFLFQAQLLRGVSSWLYWILWSILSSIVGILLYWQVRALRKSITSVTQQQLVRIVLDSRMFLIDHPQLAEQDADKDFEDFIANTGGWSRYFLRRNVISTLELLYFQRKAGAIERGFFVSHCNHIRAWFGNPNFVKTWEQSRKMHVPEFTAFVDNLLNASAEEVDPWKPPLRKFRDKLMWKRPSS